MSSFLTHRRALPLVLASAAALLSATLAATSAGAATTDPADPAKTDPSTTPSAFAGIGDPVPDGFASWDALLAVQNQLDQTADRITAAGNSSGASGYGSIVVSAKDHGLTVYWKGQVPAQVQQVLDTVPAGTTATVAPAAYSLAELQQESARLTAQAADTATGLVSIGPTADASGLQATVTTDSQTARTDLPTTIPLTVAQGSDDVKAADRDHDTSPYWGGATYYNAAWGSCSSSFAVKTPGQAVPHRLLTANHCRPAQGDKIQIGSQSIVNWGDFSNFVTNMDTAAIYIPVADRYTAPYIYRGGVAAPASQYSGVTGALGTYLGDWICTGGAKTGEHCDIKITNVEMTTKNEIHYATAQKMKPVWGGAGYYWTPDYNSVAIGHGDSGGPIFNPTYGGYVWARGSISGSGGSNSVSCPQYGTSCSSGLGFVPINYVLQAANLQLATAP